MKYLYKKPWILGILSILILGCGGTEMRKVVHNNTSYDLILHIYNKAAFGNPLLAKDSFKIKSNEMKTIYSRQTSEISCLTPLSDSLVYTVVNEPTLQVLFKTNPSENWTIVGSGNRLKGRIYQCKQVVGSADIVAK